MNRILCNDVKYNLQETLREITFYWTFYCNVLRLFTHLECPRGLFGLYCENQCHCADTGERCDGKTGHCVSGCSDGWAGDDCNTRENLSIYSKRMYIEFVNILPLYYKIITDYLFYDCVL